MHSGAVVLPTVTPSLSTAQNIKPRGAIPAYCNLVYAACDGGEVCVLVYIWEGGARWRVSPIRP